MQNLPTPSPTKEAKASIPTKNVREGPSPNLYTNETFKIPRKAAKCTLLWDLKAGKLHHLSPPQDEDARTRKKSRKEDPFSAATGEAAAKISSLNTSVRLPLAATAAVAANHADSDPSMDIHLNASGTGARRRWTTDEDTRLNKAVLVQTHDGKTQNWDAIAALIPGRTKSQCSSRWYDAFDPRNGRTTTHMAKWTPDEDDNLKEAVQMHNGKNWFAITALLPGRTKKQCRSRWHDVFATHVDRTPGRKGKWTPHEDAKLKDAVQKQGVCRDWHTIACLVQSRTKVQCRNRWR